MTLRTPRRRISPRTKLRYRAIREFFRRALGSSSQQDIQINSSIAVNVTDLKRQIVGLEQQLDAVSKHCQDISCLEDCSKRDLESFYQADLKHEIDTIKEQTEGSSDLKSNGIETQLLYKSSECNLKKSEHSCYSRRSDNDSKSRESQIMTDEHDGHVIRAKRKKSKNKLHKHKAKSVYDNVVAAYSTSSFHSLTNRNVNHDNSYNHKDRKQLKTEYTRDPHHHKNKRHRESSKKDLGDHFKGPYEGKPSKQHKSKRSTQEVDQDFIADIIRKQYKPVKMFGRKGSNMSQFSVPVCRDKEFSIPEQIQEDSELCSCFYGGPGGYSHHKPKREDINAMRSICDTRLYSSKKHLRHRDRKMPVDAYSNSDMYDLVPTKERSSPKTRRKFAEDNMIPYQRKEECREVPPSPRTLRPQLNLKAQYYNELEDYMAQAKHRLRRRSPNREKRYHERIGHYDSDFASEENPGRNVVQMRRIQKHIKPQLEDKQIQERSHQDTGTMSSFQYPTYVNEQTSATPDISFNKTQETETSPDKTDKALCEIKDILQTFLHEIKKEAANSQSDKSDISSKTSENDGNDPNCKLNNNIMPNSTSFNNYNTGQCGIAPYIAPFPNPCCYPVLPVCPMNCPMSMPNGYLMSSPSMACNCTNTAKECNSNYCNKNTDANSPTETDELIKEIYKFVAQGPNLKNNINDNKERKDDDSLNDSKMLTSRSVGGSYRQFQNDANVGTAPLKCFSKSCEAIGSRLVSDAYYSTTNASYSDTVLEKLSLEATTQSTSGTEMYQSSEQDKSKVNKFSRVLRSFGLFKKKKRDVIEELSESESVIEEEEKRRQPPFRQEVTNYMMHGQEYYHPPPVNRHQRIPDYSPPPHPPHDYHVRPHEAHPRMQEYEPVPRDYAPSPYEYQPDYHPPYNPNARDYPLPQFDQYGHRLQPRLQGQSSSLPYAPRHRPSAPPFQSSYDTSYSQMQPPLCLKEIEVQSTGTQSERKMSIFRKFKKKVQPPVMIMPMAAGDEYQRNFSTQTPRPILLPTKPAKPDTNMTKSFFSWKGLQSKAMQGMNTDPMSYSFKTQKELAEGDIKLRNAMLKKLFYKRNPFSPRNLVVRTLLGKDKSSYGEPPPMFRPRMFI